MPADRPTGRQARNASPCCRVFLRWSRMLAMNEAENKALFWLKDENAIQRNQSHERSGKISVTEHDLSGGQSALIDILRSGSPLSHELRDALASALEPIGNSLLQLKKRLRRKPGRPSKID